MMMMPLTIHKLNPHTVDAFKQLLIEAVGEPSLVPGGHRSAWQRWKTILKRPLLHVVYHSVADTLMVSPRLLPALYIALLERLPVVACLLRQDRFTPQRWYVEQSHVRANHTEAYAQVLYYVLSHYAAQGAGCFVAYVEPEAPLQAQVLPQLGFHLAHRRLLGDITPQLEAWIKATQEAPPSSTPTEDPPWRWMRATHHHAEELARCYNHQLPDLWRQALHKHPAHFYPSLNPFNTAKLDDRWQSDFSQHPQRWLWEQRHPSTGQWQVEGFVEVMTSPYNASRVQVSVFTQQVFNKALTPLLQALLVHVWHHTPQRPSAVALCYWSYQQGVWEALGIPQRPETLNETLVYIKDYHCHTQQGSKSSLGLLRGGFRATPARGAGLSPI
ncbi:MAG: hypothetical protein ACKO34_05915 [Vampirovibrionales bacterium]